MAVVFRKRNIVKDEAKNIYCFSSLSNPANDRVGHQVASSAQLKTPIDLSRIPVQCARTIVPERD